MIDVDYNEYRETIAENMKLIQEKHKLKEEIEGLNNIIKNGINEELRKELDEILKCNQRQANRIYEAIELIKRSAGYKGICTQQETDTFSKLLNILEGSDKE